MRMVKAMPICTCDSRNGRKIDFEKARIMLTKGILPPQDTLLPNQRKLDKSSIKSKLVNLR
jgi:hypothetical protein